MGKNRSKLPDMTVAGSIGGVEIDGKLFPRIWGRGTGYWNRGYEWSGSVQRLLALAYDI